MKDYKKEKATYTIENQKNKKSCKNKVNKIISKKIVIIFFSLVISFSIYIGQNNIKNKEREIGDAVQVTSLPVSGKVVILDAGHGTPDERCRK